MVTLGADCHKKTHTLVAVNEIGRQVGTCTVEATPEGHQKALRWAARWKRRSWALEDCRHVSRRLEQDLLRAAETVVRVPPKLMAQQRRSARELGKSDPIDALAVARAAQREPNLPQAQLEGAGRELRLLVDRRDDLVAERTREINRLRWHLHELNPTWLVPPRALRVAAQRRALVERLASEPGLLAELARKLLARIEELYTEIQALEQRLASMVEAHAPALTELAGCGVLTAAKLVAEVGEASRFRSPAAFAMANGTAPIPVWSGNPGRVRLNRGGNRQVNAALHRIAITQIRLGGAGGAYYAKKIAEGHSPTQARRSLRRHLSNEIYRRLRLRPTEALTSPSRLAA